MAGVVERDEEGAASVPLPLSLILRASKAVLFQCREVTAGCEKVAHIAPNEAERFDAGMGWSGDRGGRLFLNK